MRKLLIKKQIYEKVKVQFLVE